MPPPKSSPSNCSRAATSAARFDSEPPLVKMPFEPFGMPISSASQRSVVRSISASPGAAMSTLTKRLVTHPIRSAIAAVGIPPPGMNAR